MTLTHSGICIYCWISKIIVAADTEIKYRNKNSSALQQLGMKRCDCKQKMHC